MTDNHTYTVLEAARAYMDAVRQQHYLSCGLATLTNYLPDEEQREQARVLHRAAWDLAASEYDRAKAAYLKASKLTSRYQSTRKHNHLYKMEALATEYAWR